MAKFTLSEGAKSAAEYITELRRAAGSLTADELICGIDEVAKKRIDEIRSTPTDITVTGKTYYVSADGDDSADGLTESTAWRTLGRASTDELLPGDGVFFRRGDLFRGQLTVRKGVTYSAYGEGAKPKIYGWDKNSADPALWKKTDAKGVWEYAEKYTIDIGNIVFDDKTNARKVIRSDEADGSHLDFRANRVFNDYHDLSEDMTFYHDYKGTGKLYLRCNAGNPGALCDDIEMAKKQHTVNAIGGKADGVTIDNLEIAYTGSHGIGVGSSKGLTVTNCELYWIGGSIQTDVGAYGRTWPTPYGNAIEIYGEAKDYTVRNCYIHEAYDAAVTHQSGQKSHVSNKNIHYTDNVIENCVYAIEIFVGTCEEFPSCQDGVYIENNILRMGGGFGHDQRPDTGVTALIRNGRTTPDTKNYLVTNNILDRSKTRLVTAQDDGGSMAVYTDNLFIQSKDLVMIQKHGKNLFANADALSTLESFGDTGCTVVAVDELGY